MSRRYIALLSLVVMLVLSLSGCAGESCSKLTKSKEIPDKILQELAQVELEPGLYLFNHTFSDDGYSYVIICGGEEFADGYDVEIVEANYETHHDIPPEFTGSNRIVVDGRYEVKIHEIASDNNYEYCKGFKYPFVALKLRNVAEQEEWIHVSNEKKELNFNKWWGMKAVQAKAGPVAFEVIQRIEDIPPKVWKKIENLNLTRGLYEFEQGEYEDDAYYFLVCGGERYSDGYNVTLEGLWPDENAGQPQHPREITWLCKIILRECSNDSQPYAKGFDYPFVVCKIEHRDNLICDLPSGFDTEVMNYMSSIIVIDENVKPDILFTEWSMED